MEKGKSFLSFLRATTSRACHTASLARVTGALVFHMADVGEIARS